jgi:GNAT superfamily N-acetyltransferase
MALKLQPAAAEDAEAIAALRNAVSDDLTFRYGRGWWTGHCTTAGVLADFRDGQVWVGLRRGEVIATLKLSFKKPWAINLSYFPKAKRPLYLTSMAVAPECQRQGIGRTCLDQALRAARREGADAIFLDAYDHPEAGAGTFYARCGWRETGRANYRGVPLIYYERSVPGLA